tara:strand:- start:2925 stop:3359 length:435 start_codon:yes stop_codon:yes gene_type:complete
MTANASPDLLSSLIGKPYQPGGQGPEVFDCWGLVKYVYEEVFQTHLQDFSHIYAHDLKACSAQIESSTGSTNWLQVETPSHGSVVAMSRSKILHHVGVWLDIDGGLCLHAVDGQAVIAQNLQRLKQERFTKILFFNYGPGLPSY